MSFKIRPEIFLILFGSCIGILYIIAVPPFQPPDESNHFYRAYQVSEGKFMAVKHDDRVGGFMPRSMVAFAESTYDIRANCSKKTSFAKIMETGNVDLDEGDSVFVDFPNTAMYTPVSYIPQAVGLALGRLLGLKVVMMFYLARLVTLACWLTAMFLVVRAIPVFKWFMVFLAFLPTSMGVHMSLSADVMTNILGFSLVAFFFRQIYTSDAFSPGKFYLLLMLAVMIVMSKVVYAPVLLLWVLIPRHKFKSTRQFFVLSSILVVLVLVFLVVFSKLAGSLYVPYEAYNPEFHEAQPANANMYSQLELLKDHPSRVVMAIFNSAVGGWEFSLRTFVGVLGWLDTTMPEVVIVCSFLLLVVLACTGNTLARIPVYHKLVFLAIAFVTYSLIIISQILTWEGIGACFTQTQGRYYFLVFPFIFFLLGTKSGGKHSLLVSLVGLYIVVSSIVCVKITYNRYFLQYRYQLERTLTCDFEDFDVSGSDTLVAIKGTDKKFYGYAVSRSDSAMSGRYCVRMTPSQTWGPKTDLDTLCARDNVEFTIWCKGQGGTLVLGGKKLYAASNQIVQQVNGWSQLSLKSTIPDGLEKKGDYMAYFYNSSGTYVLFDNAQIKVSRCVTPFWSLH